MLSSGRPHIVLIDGRSGAGKTSFAKNLARERGGYVLSLDEVYPGWDGLDAGSSHVYRHVFGAWDTNGHARYRRWDWAGNRPAEWVDIPETPLLVVEGCGAIRTDALRYSSELYWLNAPERIRKERTEARDGDAFVKHWVRWALQEERFLLTHESDQKALVIDTSQSGVSNGA